MPPAKSSSQLTENKDSGSLSGWPLRRGSLSAVIGDGRAAEQADAADEAGASDDASPLICVFSAPREDRARGLVGSESPLPYQTHDRGEPSQRGARPRDLKASQLGDTVSVTACHGACGREPSAAPRLRSRPISKRGPQRDSPLNMRQGALGPSRDTETDSRRLSCSRRDVRQATFTTWARMVAPCGCGA